jgi:hypothetical protein
MKALFKEPAAFLLTIASFCLITYCAIPISLTIAMAFVAYILGHSPGLTPFRFYLPSAVPFMIALALAVAGRPRQNNATSNRSHVLLLLAATLSLYFSFSWLGITMHDIGLLYGSHGRWGCSIRDSSGQPSYWLRDDTVPWIALTPVMLLIVADWIACRSRCAPNRRVEWTANLLRRR